MTTETTTGFVGQSMWDEPGAGWHDTTMLVQTSETARERVDECVSYFNRKQKGRPGCIRKGIKATRIVRRTIEDVEIE